VHGTNTIITSVSIFKADEPGTLEKSVSGTSGEKAARQGKQSENTSRMERGRNRQHLLCRKSEGLRHYFYNVMGKLADTQPKN